MGVASGCGEQEVGVASGSGWNLWVWLLGVVVRRYIDFLILLIYPYSFCICSFYSSIPSLTLGAHARGLQYLSCLCVFPYSGTSRNQAYKQQYQRLQRDAGMKCKKGFFFKTLRSEVMASFTHLE